MTSYMFTDFSVATLKHRDQSGLHKYLWGLHFRRLWMGSRKSFQEQEAKSSLSTSSQASSSQSPPPRTHLLSKTIPPKLFPTSTTCWEPAGVFKYMNLEEAFLFETK